MISAGVITGIFHQVDSSTIASLRRTLGLVVVSTAIWLAPVLVGLAFSPVLKGAVLNEFVFGGFLAWGFEIIVVNGVFLRSTGLSLVVAAVHPLPIILTSLYFMNLTHLAIPVTGFVLLAVVLVFLALVKRVKTRNGTESLVLLRAFLKTWVERNPRELETLFSTYAKNDSVTTDVMAAKTESGRAIIVIPGIHPGPFAPVGSYNVSELVYGALRSVGITALVLHGTGGHERNLPTNELAQKYATVIAKFSESVGQVQHGKPLMRGPLRSKVGITNVETLNFGSHVIAIVSNAPFRSDDFDPSTLADAFSTATELGLQITIVDAHNSVDGEEGHQETISADSWHKILKQTLSLQEVPFRFGVANSDEIGFEHGSDISDGGISVAIFAVQSAKYVLVSADANNAKAGLRERVEARVEQLGMELLDLCTSDTHKLAARNLTRRGYFALGEQTSPDVVVDCVARLVHIADGRLSDSDFIVNRLESSFPLIGEESLDDFAGLTGKTISITKRYAKVAGPIIALLLAITLFY